MRDTYIPASETYVYEEDEGIKGFFSLCESTLAAMFVAPAHQGKGIGRMLIQKAKELRSDLTLRVYTDNEKAVQFYEMCGFKPVSQEVDEHTGHAELLMKFGS
jgi:putative acetyltransferase